MQYSYMEYDGVGNLTGMYAYAAYSPARLKQALEAQAKAGTTLRESTQQMGLASFSGTTTYRYSPGAGEANRVHGPLREETGGPLGNRSFGYDAAYNRVSSGSGALTYNAANQLIWTGYAYDHHGNPTTYKGSTLTFDAESRLKQYGTFSAGYNGDGLRAWKQVGSAKTFYLYDGTNLVAEYNANGTLAATNTFGANGLLFRKAGALSHFYEFDPMGNVVRAEDQSFNTLGTWSYDAYGNRTGATPAGPYLYGGQWGYYTDVETGLNLCTHRYYDPGLGRWLTRDPIGYEGGINLYRYVNGNPVNYGDPEGLLRFPWQRRPGEERKVCGETEFDWCEEQCRLKNQQFIRPTWFRNAVNESRCKYYRSTRPPSAGKWFINCDCKPFIRCTNTIEVKVGPVGVSASRTTEPR